MSSDFKAPGLAARRNTDGTFRYYWRASRTSHKPNLVRLHGPQGEPIDLGLEPHRVHVKALCERLQAEMIGRGGVVQSFDGTLRTLISKYENDEDSPFQSVRSVTRRVYAEDLGRLRKACGAARLAQVGAAEIRRWYKAAYAPKVEGAPNRIRSAHGLMVMLRILMKYGSVEGVPHAKRIKELLSDMRFETPVPRQVKPTYEQARAVIDKAIEREAYSIAFGVALQFEGMMRQWDVIGSWDSALKSDIMLGRRGWHGPRWKDIKDGVLYWVTGKKKRPIQIDLSLYPMVMETMKLVPAALPNAPLIIDERTGRPYSEGSYSKRFRKIADAAGLPAEIWSRDFRAGGVSEGEAAGASMPDIAKHAAHTDPNFTARVYGRSFLESARRVAHARIKHRENKG